jgi:tRNA threonylcarbamoyl adenosine modification protein YeaZ
MTPTILAFDTSAAHCAAVLLRAGHPATLHAQAMTTGQAEALMPLLARTLADAAIAWADVDAIAVGTGPGNFTGVRISVSAARGLALALARPAIGITTFEALAHGLARPATVAIPAPRGMIHRQTFAATGPLPPETLAGEAPPIDPVALVTAIARIAATRLDAPQPRPAPFYLRGPDAAPPRDPAPRILD